MAHDPRCGQGFDIIVTSSKLGDIFNLAGDCIMYDILVTSFLVHDPKRFIDLNPLGLFTGSERF